MVFTIAAVQLRAIAPLMVRSDIDGVLRSRFGLGPDCQPDFHTLISRPLAWCFGTEICDDVFRPNDRCMLIRTSDFQYFVVLRCRNRL